MKNSSPSRSLIFALILVGSLLYFFANFQRSAIPGAVFNEIQNHWHLGAAQVTSLGTTFMYIYAIMQLAVGIFISKFGGIRVILAGGIIFSLGNILFLSVSNYYLLCTARFMGGLGSGCIYLGVIAVILRFFEKNYALMISMLIMIGYAGGVIANAPFTIAVSGLGLIKTLWIAALAGCAVYLLFVLFSLFISKPAVKKIKSPLGSIWRPLTGRHNLYVFGLSAFNWGLYYSLQTVIGKKYLEDFCGISQSTASVVLSCTGIISAVAGFLYAWGSQRIGFRRQPFCRLTSITTPVIFVLFNLLLLADIRNIIPAILLLCLAAVSSLSSTLIPVLKETNREENAGQAIAMLNFLAYFSVAVIGNIIGWCLELFPAEHSGDRIIYSKASYQLTFLIMGVISLAAMYCGTHIRETNGKYLEVN